MCLLPPLNQGIIEINLKGCRLQNLSVLYVDSEVLAQQVNNLQLISTCQARRRLRLNDLLIFKTLVEPQSSSWWASAPPSRTGSVLLNTALVVIGDIMGMEMNHALSLRMPREENAWLAPSMILSSMTVNYGKIRPNFWLGKIKGLQIIGPETFISKQRCIHSGDLSGRLIDCNEMEIVCTKYILDIWMKVRYLHCGHL